MPRLFAIHAVTFAARGDLSTRIAPPYDVLDEGPKRQLLARDGHNIVAIDLPVTPPKTVGPDEAYQQAGETLRQWLEEGVLARLDRPAVVAYEQRYEVAGRSFSRRGLFAALGVEPFNRKGGGIFRHELTIQGGLDDRYKLMQATAAQLSPVFGIYADPRKVVSGLLAKVFDGEPDFFGTTEHDRVLHRCWLIHDPRKVAQLGEFFERTNVFIADGHHRYTTALTYAGKHSDVAEAQRCLFVLVAAEDPGMIVLPTHRVVRGMSGYAIDRLLQLLPGAGIIAEESDAPPQGEHVMGLYDGDTQRRYLIRFRERDPLAATHADKPAVWRQLDVAILQHAIIDAVLKPHFGRESIRIAYTADADDLIAMTESAPGQLGVLMQPTPLASVMAVSLADEVMPAKSTFFYPKLATGLVINPLAGGGE